MALILLAGGCNPSCTADNGEGFHPSTVIKQSPAQSIPTRFFFVLHRFCLLLLNRWHVPK